MTRPLTPAVARWLSSSSKLIALAAAALALPLLTASAWASELDLQLPTLGGGQRQLLFIGLGDLWPGAI